MLNLRMRQSNQCGERIQLLRKNKNLNQVDIAAALDVDFNIKLDRSDISEIERGVRGIKDYELDAIAYILEVDPTWLLRGDS